ncbi:MAG: Inner rane protein YihY, formerly thought to be RNase [Labilithrix sp.]|nr:Inner rane protein YihY, formerly thought to be RNase [Labilithrix sp.]
MSDGKPSMKERAKRVVSLLSKSYDRFDEVEGFRLGAAFSYYATFAIFPLILLMVTLVGYVIGDSAVVRDRILSSVASADTAVTGTIEQTLVAMQDASAQKTSAIVGLVSLLISTSGAFVELDFALNKIWKVTPRKGVGVVGSIKVFLAERASGLACVLGVGIFLVASLVMGACVGVVERHTALPKIVLELGSFVISITLLTAAVTAAFHYVPRSRPAFRDVVPGAFATALLLTALKAIFATYLSKLTSYSAYGVAGGVLALATWIYLSSQIIYFGATATRVHCEERGCACAKNAPGAQAAPSAAPLHASAAE